MSRSTGQLNGKWKLCAAYLGPGRYFSIFLSSGLYQKENRCAVDQFWDLLDCILESLTYWHKYDFWAKRNWKLQLQKILYWSDLYINYKGCLTAEVEHPLPTAADFGRVLGTSVMARFIWRGLRLDRAVLLRRLPEKQRFFRGKCNRLWENLKALSEPVL